MHTTKHWLTGTCVLAAFCCLTVADESSPSKKERPSREASVNAGDMLERFVDELILVTPGSSQFPESLDVGGRMIAPDTSFRIAANETTQELYQLVTGKNPSRWRGPRNSVESMTCADAERFCSKLTVLLRDRQLIEDTAVVRLPTDVEWEYACRAGSVDTYCFGSDRAAAELLNLYAWHSGNAVGNDPAVGELKPNQYGLYDVHGYLWEFVSGKPVNNPAAKGGAAANRAMGGSWKDDASRLACNSRILVPGNAVSDAIGFRCVVASDLTNTKNGVGE